MTVGDIIKHYRNIRRLSLEDVGKACNVSKVTVLKWERGDIQNIRRDKIENLSRILNISPITLITGELPANDESISSNEFMLKLSDLLLQVNDLEYLEKQQIMNFAKMTVEYKAMKKDASTHKLGVDNNRQM